jgi:hypothetical protein
MIKNSSPCLEKNFAVCVPTRGIASMWKLFTTMWSAEPRKNACFDCLTYALFLTCTEGIFFFYVGYTRSIFYNIQGMHEFCMEEKPLTWNVSSLYMAANPYTCWSLAQSQLPHLRPPSPFCPPSAIALFPPTQCLFTYRRH